MWQTLSQSIIYPPNLITHRVELHVKDGRAAENYEGKMQNMRACRNSESVSKKLYLEILTHICEILNFELQKNYS